MIFFIGFQGFSYADLRNFRQFYLIWPDFEKCYTLRSKLSWSHNRLIMRVDDETARYSYAREATEQGWTVRELERQIRTASFQRLLPSARESSTRTQIRRHPEIEVLAG